MRLSALSLSWFAVALLAAGRLCGADTDLKWDFEAGVGDWKAWGVKGDEASAETLKKIVQVESGQAHGGQNCLVVRDELDNSAPYAIVRIPVDVSGIYVLKGWIRAEADLPAGNYIGVSTVAAGADPKTPDQDRFIDWLGTPKIGVGREWHEFQIKLATLSAPVTHLYLAVRPTAYDNLAARAAVQVDDLEFVRIGSKGAPLGEMTKLDLSGAVNRGLQDEADGDRQGGWTDQGNNDLRGLKPGPRSVCDIPFAVLDPAANGGKAVVALRAGDDFFAESAEIALNGQTGDWLYLLDTGAWVAAGRKAGSVEFVYADGERASAELEAARDVGDWWGGFATSAKAVKLTDANPVKSPVYLFATAVKNPRPDRPLAKLILHSSGEKGNPTIWLVLGATLGRGGNALDLLAAQIDKQREEWVPFRMGPFPAAAPLVDLSTLLDTPAGKHGFLQSRDGHFYFADGTRARFFADNVHSHFGLFPSHDQAERAALNLARLGVNLVRLHLTEGVLIDDTRPDRQTFITGEKLERFDYFVKCLKDRGIYILMDSLTGLSARKFQPADGVVGAEVYGSHRPWAFYDPRLKELAKNYLTQFITHVNQHTGNRLVDEPAVALMMLINEQSLFFDWGASKGTPDHYTTLLRKLYGEWLLKKLNLGPDAPAGTARAALAKLWTNEQGETALLPDEDPAAGSVALPSLSAVKGAGGAWSSVGSPVRIKSTLAFMQDIQNDYNREMKALIASLGGKVPVASSNIIYNVPELVAQASLDYTSQNEYHDHVKNLNGRALFMSNQPAVLMDPISGQSRFIETAIAGIKLNTLPVTSTESDMMWPHEWRASYFLSLFSTAALQDWDAIFHYCHMGGWNHSWDTADETQTVLNPTVEFNDPALAGTQPAAALMFHRRDVAPAKNLVQVVYSAADQLDGRREVRGAGFPFNYLTFVSRVEGVFGQPDGRAQALVGGTGEGAFAYAGADDTRTPRQLSDSLDSFLKQKQLLAGALGIQDGKLLSDTGEICRDWTQGLLTIDTPRTQAFTGFPAAPIQLSTVEFACRSPFATIILNSLDEAPLAEARRIFITAVGRAENNADKYSYQEIVAAPSGYRRGEGMAVERGPAGQVVTERIAARLSLKLARPDATATLTPLKPDFTALAEGQALTAQNGVLAVELGEAATIWYLLEIK